MQSTSPAASIATNPPGPITTTSLLAAFARVADPRRQASIRYSLAAILALTVTAILVNQRGVLAIVEWAACQPAEVLGPLGFTPGRTPCQSTLQRLFAKLDAASLSATVQTFFASRVAPDPLVRGGQGVAIDGKAQRDRLQSQTSECPVHALTASTDLNGYSDWPALAQGFRLERTWRERGKRKRMVHYGITSLPATVADASRLLALRRGYWGIENELHYVKDVVLGGDASLVHRGQGPTILTTLRDTGCRTITRRLRAHADAPTAVALVAQPLLTHA